MSIFGVICSSLELAALERSLIELVVAVYRITLLLTPRHVHALLAR